STAAVYGEPEYSPIDECHRLEPINYYGFTKQKCEEIIEWYSKLKGIIGISLRYFNVAGDCGLNYVDPEAENIFPIIMEVYTGVRKKLTVFGKDYETRDGTCIRDYIDVNDLVDAHILALDLNENVVINIGSEKGTSVKELIDGFDEFMDKKLNWEYGDRRAGDPAKLTASVRKADDLMGWKASRDIKDMIKSTIKAYNSNK
ncbi:MAG: GDP-mannose 4,6-dehydratase, partial [Nanoarchaeota archaeon]|nr:GDP-mannose 4,6-dehydratase [Nanoarchaeota archaeon]